MEGFLLFVELISCSHGQSPCDPGHVCTVSLLTDLCSDECGLPPGVIEHSHSCLLASTLKPYFRLSKQKSKKALVKVPEFVAAN